MTRRGSARLTTRIGVRLVSGSAWHGPGPFRILYRPGCGT
jgi:hypothetical protein